MPGIFHPASLSARLSIGAALLWLALSPAARSAEEMPVTVVIARENAMTEKVPVVGSLVAREEVQVHPLVQGKAIQHVLVEAGQTVKKGQPLALLDTTEAGMLLDKNSVSMLRARAAVAVEESKLEVARIGLEGASKVLERSRALRPKGAVSQQMLDEHEIVYARANAEFSLARQSLMLAEADAALIARERDEIDLTMERSTVRAPVGGLVLRRTARIGAMTAGSGDPLFVLAKDAAIELVAHVTETSFVRLGEDMPAELTLAGHAGTIGGLVRLSAAELDPATRSGEIRVALDEAPGLRPGMFVRGTVSVSERRNILLPGTAVKTAGGASNVFVVDNGVVDLRPVTVGARQDGFVEIVAGIRDGEMVVLKSGGLLKTNEKVKAVIVPPDETPSGRLASSSMLNALEVVQ